MGSVPQFWDHETPKTPPQKNWHETWTSNLWKGKSFEPNLHDFEIHVSVWGVYQWSSALSHTDGDVDHLAQKTQTIKHTAGVHVAKIRNDNFCDCSDCADEVNWNCDTCGAFDGDDGEEATDVGSVRGEKVRVRVPGREEMRKKKVPCCAFFVWVVFVGQEDLHTVSLVET